MTPALHSLLRDLRGQPLSFHPPASEAELRQLEVSLGFHLPSALRAWYADHDGMEPGPLALRLMPVAEVLTIHEVLADSGWRERGVRFFWTDDASNHAGIYVEGPLTGRICLDLHGSGDISPRFRGVERLLQVLLETSSGGELIEDLPTDYPEIVESSNVEQSEDDARLSHELRERAVAAPGESRRHLLLCAVAVTPFARTHELLELLDDLDPQVVRAVCRLMGLRRHTPALQPLFRVARRGLGGSTQAALSALAGIGSGEARERLIQLATSGPRGYTSSLADALRDVGCQVRPTGDGGLELQTSTGAWVRLP